MAHDIAIDFNTGDLLLGAGNDVASREGNDTIGQAVRIRLKLERGTWDLDPSDGELGGKMNEALRSPSQRTQDDIGRYVREALEPKTDIVVHDVDIAVDPTTSAIISIGITYQTSTTEATVFVDPQTIALVAG